MPRKQKMVEIDGEELRKKVNCYMADHNMTMVEFARLFGKHDTQFHNASNRNKIDRETLDILEDKAGITVRKINPANSMQAQQTERENKEVDPVSLAALEVNVATIVEQNRQIISILKSLMEALS